MFGKLQNCLRHKGIDVALFFDGDSNLRYFSGVRIELGCLAVPANGRPLLFIPGFEAERIAKSSSVGVMKIEGNVLSAVCSYFNAKKIGIVPNAISYADVQSIKSLWNAKLVSVEDACVDLRLVKSREEVRRITKACAITDVLFSELCKHLPLFKTELDVANFLKSRISQFGLEPSFPPIVASGANAAVPHHVPNNSKLHGFTVIDFGIIFRNYCSDLTRTVYFGRPSAKEVEAYNGLLRVQKACIGKVKSGVLFEDINAFARKKLGRFMMHKLGHSLGVEVHDARPLILQKGNVISIEPGIYHPERFGIRIEDDVLITEKGCILLTRSPKELNAIPR